MSEHHSPAALLPVFLKLTGRRVLVVGGGPVAGEKVRALLATGARITVVSPQIDAAMPAGVATRRRRVRRSDVDRAWFVVAAAPPAVNRRVARWAAGRGVFVNAVDDPANASAYLGSVIRRGDVTIAVSTSGRAPALAALLREAIEALLPADLPQWLGTADRLRASWRAKGTPWNRRRPALARAIARLYPPEAPRRRRRGAAA